MKKSRRTKWFKRAFWALFLLGCLWLAFAPPRNPAEAPGVTVKVHRSLDKTVKKEPTPQQSPSNGVAEPYVPPDNEAPQVGAVIPVQPEPEPKPIEGRKAKIAIIIDDVGPDLRGSERAIALPAPVTLSFLPYAVRVKELARQAKADGHELMLHMPMEPLGRENPGPGALLTTLPMDELHGRLQTALNSFSGYDGINNHMGSKFTAYADGMTMVVEELKQRRLFFVDSRTSAQSLGRALAEQKGLPTIGRDVFLDDDQSAAAVQAQLKATERVALRKGRAVAIGHPHAGTLQALENWIPDAEQRGFEFVPVSRLIRSTKP